MNKNKLQALESIITPILEQFPNTRDSDKILYYRVLLTKGLSTNITLKQFLLGCDRAYPSYDSVSRCRRKIQAVRWDLRSSDGVQDTKDTEEEQYIAYAVDREVKRHAHKLF